MVFLIAIIYSVSGSQDKERECQRRCQTYLW